jgi:molecular chaperone GrpE
VSKPKTFSEKLNNFFLGERIPVLSDNDLDNIEHLDNKLDELLALLKTTPARPEPAPLPTDGPAAAQPFADDLSEQIRKLAKTQFKANTLQETQLAQQQETSAELRKSIEQQEKRLVELTQQQQQALKTAQLELIQSLLPALDSLDAAFENGRRQVLKQPMPAESRRAVIAWLDGIRLARMRLLDVLKSYNVTPIPTLGQPFDPHRHVAVATDSSGRESNGIIVSEDQRGYATPDKVLRFARVVVAQSNQKN